MRSFRIGLTAAAMVILTFAGCGHSDEKLAERAPPAESAPEKPAESTATAETAPRETLADQAPAHATWTTVATLRSSDAPWQDMDGILVSKPFTATGEVQIVLDMPNAAATDGVVGVIIPADKANDVRELLGALRDGVAVTMIGAAPEQVISDLDGSYVFVNSVPAPKPWSLDLKTRP